MESLGLYKMRIPSTGAEVTGEKFSVHGRVVFQVKGHLFAEDKLEVIEEITDKKILPNYFPQPWNE